MTVDIITLISPVALFIQFVCSIQSNLVWLVFGQQESLDPFRQASCYSLKLQFNLCIVFYLCNTYLTFEFSLNSLSLLTVFLDICISLLVNHLSEFFRNPWCAFCCLADGMKAGRKETAASIRVVADAISTASYKYGCSRQGQLTRFTIGIHVF